MLTAAALTKSFGGFEALSRCSLEIARQSITGIIGPNGAGKSTLFNILGGLLAPESGDVVLEGRSILDLRAEERAGIAKARALLEQVDLWSHANEPAKNLSGGQKKLLEISRALMLEPKIILLDEPTAGVSPAMTEAPGRTVLQLRNQDLMKAYLGKAA